MTRREMEAKILELEAELKVLKDKQSCHCNTTCVHWQYYNVPNYTATTTWPITWTSGNSQQYQIGGPSKS